ncbi:MAG: DUF2975 domain-containing protein [Eubacterium sp.]|nr:DUF2975 domain-containing protein [Eubacterium sp.]MCI8919624.1 DUF2975 domain-containing protein [Eubacterium sp.]
MKQSEIAKWLKLITWAIGILGAVFFFFLMPILAEEMKRGFPEAAYLYWPGLVYGYVIAAGCYAILFQFWTVCREIGRDNSFSKENAAAFKKISTLALVLAGVWFAGFAGLIVIRCVQPALMLFIIFAIFLSFVVAICAAALSHLVWKAYELKQENELTI